MWLASAEPLELVHLDSL
jgi:hypothetical protein